jgi:dGTPase
MTSEIIKWRNHRKHGSNKRSEKADTRIPSEIDRDRILYSDGLRRLGGVTQVAGPGENHQFHNRYSHTNKVSQIAQRLTQRFLADNPSLADQLDINVVEAAALAHDLGHPPFGHIAEQELDLLVRGAGNKEGYEGNAQSFRILTTLMPHSEEYDGLDLTMATLNAVLKYPWKRLTTIPLDKKHKQYKKFGVYSENLHDFDLARKYSKPNMQSLEAQIMDYADEVAYSIHDFEDFYRAGFLPIDSIKQAGEEFGRFMDSWKADLEKNGDLDGKAWVEKNNEQFLDLLEYLPERYRDTFEDRAQVRRFTSQNVSRFVSDVFIQDQKLQYRDHTQLVVIDIEKRIKYDLRFMQRFIWVYVIRNPRLASQQLGQRRVIRTLYGQYLKALRSGKGDQISDLIPPVFHRLIKRLQQDPDQQYRREMTARVAADIVSSLNDQQALTIYSRFVGLIPGSIHDALD